MTPEAYLHFLSSYWWILVLLMVVILQRQILRLFGVVLIPQSSVGIVDKRYALVGRNRTLAEGQIVALDGEAGIQADTLAPGLHFFLWPWQYSIKLQDFLVVPQDCIGVVEARGGIPLTEGRVLGKRVECKAFQDARAFLVGGGQRGPQITIIPPGTYRINTSVFSVNTAKVLEIPVNAVGVVTIKDGKPLTTGEIAGPEVKDHNSFQDAQAFIDAGGYKGLQEQVMLAGRYFINPMFATVEIKPMTAIPIANVGVVIAYVGEPGKDVTGDAFKHGNIVGRGEKGVWNDPLDPGMYPINPYTIRVELVPTANVVLNWADGKSEAHNLDKDLSTITVRSSDGFKFNLDVSQIIHIPRADAPKVIARFGSMVNLVTQVLEPTIGNYFRNAAQNSDVIDFLKNRQVRQAEARKSISDALQEYNVGAVDTLIGDITPPDELMKTLTDRKIADQRKVTFDSQRLAEDNRRELEKSKAMADTQASVVTAERSVTIAGFAADATIKQAEGQARAKTVNAEADATVAKVTGEANATVTKVTGDADAGKTLAVGTAEADVIKLKIASMTSDNYAVIETAKALAASGFKLVPDIVASGDGGGSNSLMNIFLARLIKDSNGATTPKT
ncbi:MAG TPA: SPFH domain-containing protein [Candidatus Saccharimonadales bacterium]|jgi:uncharacterized membrane protein YqiK|nr:SPFH domain-containing protein [Candidatus Saccharimonadales bacterium]